MSHSRRSRRAGSTASAPRIDRSPASAPRAARASRALVIGSLMRAPRSAIGSGGCLAAASPPIRLQRARALAAGEDLVEDRHPDDQAARHLGGDQRGRAVDHLGGELDAAVDRAGVHDELARLEPARVDLVVDRVLAQRGDEGVVHPLLLHPQRVDDVGLAEVVEV